MFDLKDPEKVETIHKITFQEVETIYWKCEDCLSENKNKNAKLFFEMLCYLAKHRNEFLKSALNTLIGNNRISVDAAKKKAI